MRAVPPPYLSRDRCPALCRRKQNEQALLLRHVAVQSHIDTEETAWRLHSIAVVLEQHWAEKTAVVLAITHKIDQHGR